ncbi:MAG: hypothetical protein ACI853_000650, partial [Paracoccaceae bacterium]
QRVPKNNRSTIRVAIFAVVQPDLVKDSKFHLAIPLI